MTLLCLSVSKIQESECVASSSEQNYAIFVMTFLAGNSMQSLSSNFGEK